MSKRAFSVCDSSSPPSKRRHILSSSPSYVTDALHTPRTPHRTRYPIISDSPTNPFGRKRALNLALPRSTSFGKHLALRFQLINNGGCGGDKDGVYRIVQVPLNYTFRLLHKLLLFLFGDGTTAFLPGSRNPSEYSGRTRKVKTKEEKIYIQNCQRNSGHLFEAKKSITMHRAAYKAGKIRNAQTWAKLSSVRDPYRYLDDDHGAAEEGGVSDGKYPCDGGLEVDSGDEEAVEWRWEAEEDITLAQVWPKGPDLSRGIVYHHDSRTQIHITMNTISVPARKGISNKPFVFLARGVVSLSGGIAKVDNIVQDVSTYRWNRPHAFENFLKQSSETKPVANLIEDTGNITSRSIVSSFPTPGLSTTSSAASTPACDPIYTPITPGPTHPIHQLRLDHAHKRIARLAKKGMDELAELGSDEEEEVEIDELVDEDPNPEVGGSGVGLDAVAEWEGKGRKKNWREVLQGWEWDPFRDEVEV